MPSEPNTIQRKDIYLQLCEEFRSLNVIFWRVPILAMSLNGGLGFALGSVRLSPEMQTALLIFMFLCNSCFILILYRLRKEVMQDVLDRIAQMEHRQPRRPRFHVVYLFMLVLGSAALFSIVAIPFRSVFFPPHDGTPTFNITIPKQENAQPFQRIDE